MRGATLEKVHGRELGISKGADAVHRAIARGIMPLVAAIDDLRIEVAELMAIQKSATRIERALEASPLVRQIAANLEKLAAPSSVRPPVAAPRSDDHEAGRRALANAMIGTSPLVRERLEAIEKQLYPR